MVTRQQTPLLRRNITKDEEITKDGLYLVVACRKELDFAAFLKRHTVREAKFERYALSQSRMPFTKDHIKASISEMNRTQIYDGITTNVDHETCQ